MEAAAPWNWRDAVRPGLHALKTLWAPFLLIQAAGAAIVLSYYRSEGLREISSHLSSAKVHGGVPFALAAGAVAGGVIPEIAKFLTGSLKKLDRAWAARAGYNAFAYGIIGVIVDQLYTIQTLLFGSGIDPRTLVIKTAFDMLVFSPIIGVPVGVLIYEWRAHQFRPRDLAASLSWKFYRDKVFPALVLAWAFWIPMLFCVYALPSDLQFVFAMFAEAAWSILFVFVATRSASESV